MEIKSRYDEIARFEARRDQPDPWVMYLVVRVSLDMDVGKIATQCGHAVGKIYDHAITLKSTSPLMLNEVELDLLSTFDHWADDSFRKIVLVGKESKWEQIKEKLTCVVVRDAGLTEVRSGSETVIGVWPMRRSEQPQILKKLQALR